MGGDITAFLIRWRQRATLLLLVLGVVSVVLGAFANGGRQQAISFGLGTALISAAIIAFIAVETDLFQLVHVNQVRALGIDRGFTDRRNLGDDFWLRLVNSARRRYDIVGVANHGYLGTAESRNRFEEAFRGALARKRMRMCIYFLNPESQYSIDREAEEQHRHTRVDTVDAMQWFRQLQLELEGDHRDRLQLFEYQATPSCGITRSDDQLVVTLYVAGRLNLRAPGLILNEGHRGLSGVYAEQFEEIKDRSSGITAERLAQLVVLRNEWDTAAPGLRSEGEIRQEIEQGEDQSD